MVRRSRGFTLIELLVVVAIIALLISILLPSLKEARSLAKAVACGANMKNLGNAFHMYTTDNTGHYPGGHKIVGGRDSVTAWAPRILKYLQGERKVYRCQEVENSYFITPEYTTNTRFSNPSIIALGYEPGERGMMNDTINGRVEVFSYGYNEAGVDTMASSGYSLPCLGLGVHPRPNGGDPIGEVQEKEIRHPSMMIVIGDSVADGEWDAWLSPVLANETEHPSSRHQEGSNILFADAHVAKMKKNKLLPQEFVGGPIDEAEMRIWNNDFEPHREREGWQ